MSNSTSVQEIIDTFIAIQISDRKKGFKAHLISYLAINISLLAINLLTNPDKLWSLGSILGWGIGVFFHYIMFVGGAEKKLKGMAEKAQSEK